MKYDIEFFNELEKSEQHDILYFARAYMRVRELHLDKTYSVPVRQHYSLLEAKLVHQLEEK